MRRWLRIGLVVVVAAALAAAVQLTVHGQPQGTDPSYDGRFTFVRLRWGSDFGFSRRGGFSSAWNHDYPRAEQHLSLILKELTALDIRVDAGLNAAQHLDEHRIAVRNVAVALLTTEQPRWRLPDFQGLGLGNAEMNSGSTKSL